MKTKTAKVIVKIASVYVLGITLAIAFSGLVKPVRAQGVGPHQPGRIWSSGFELQTTTANVEITAVTGSPSINTTTKRSGAAALRTNPSSATQAVSYSFATANATDDFYFRAYIYIASAPAAQTDVVSINDSTPSSQVTLRLNTDRTLTLYNYEDSAQVGSASSAIPLTTWTRLELKVDANTIGSTELDARINGTSFASGTVNHANGVMAMQVGVINTSTTADLYWDDLAINRNDAGTSVGPSFRNNWPGDGKIIHLKPNGNGTNTAWTGDYTAVDEVTPNDGTDTIVCSASQNEDYTLEDATANGISSSDTIRLALGGVRVYNGASATSHNYTLTLLDGGTADGTGVLSSVTINTNNTSYSTIDDTAPRNYQYLSVNRAGVTVVTPWTPSLLDSAQIRVGTTDCSPVTTISTVWVLVEYTSTVESLNIGGRLFTSGFENQSTAANVEFTAVTSATIDTAVKKSGAASLLADAASESAEFDFESTDTADDYYLRTYIYVTSAPAGQTIVLSAYDTGNTQQASLRMNTDRSLELWNEEDGVQVGSDSEAVPIGAWTMLELKVDATTIGSTALEGKLNGTAFASGTVNLANGIMTMRVGNQSAVAAQFNFDDLAVNKGTGSFQNSYPGEGSVVHLRPNANGPTAPVWTLSPATCNGSSVAYECVDEVTPNDATDMLTTTTANQQAEFELTSTSTAGIPSSSTVSLVTAGVRFGDSAATASAFQLAVIDVTNKAGTVGQEIAINTATYNTNAFAAPRLSPLTLYERPHSTSSWTLTDLDSARMQIRLSADGGTNTINVSALWLQVEYVQPRVTTAATTGTQTASLFVGSTGQHIGATFSLASNYAVPHNVTAITIAENGTVNGQTNLDNIQLWYEMDTTTPFDCASEAYGSGGSELQFGSTDTDGFSAANGTAAFSGTSVAINTGKTMCVYVRLDVGSGASASETIEVEITNPSTDVTVSSGTVTPGTAVALAGTTTITVAFFVSGNVYGYDADESGASAVGNPPCDDSTNVVRIRVNGTSQNTITSCSLTTGAYLTLLSTPSVGDTITVYLDGVTANATSVTRYDGAGNVTLDLYENTVRLTSEDATAITNSILDLWDSGNEGDGVDGDIGFTVTTSNLVVSNTRELRVVSGKTFTPGGTVTTNSTSTSASVGADVNIIGTGVLNMGSNALSVGGDFNNVGTLTLSAGQNTTFTATGSGFVVNRGSSEFYNIVFNGSGGNWSHTDGLYALGNLTMTAGTLSGTVDVVVEGDVTGTAGVINKTGGTLTHYLSGSKNFGPTTASTNWIFNDLHFEGQADGYTSTTQSCSNCNITVNGTLLVSVTGMPGNNVTLNAGGSTWNLNGSNNSDPFNVDQKGGVLTASTSTFVYGGAYASGNVNVENVTYNNLTFSGADTFVNEGALTVSGNLSVGTGAILSQGNYAFTVSGTTGVTGTLNTTGGATGTRTFTGTLTVNAGGTFDTSAQDPAVSFGAGIVQNSANTLYTGSGAVTLVGNLSGSGAGNIDFGTGGSVAIPSGTTTNNFTGAQVKVIGTLTLTGNWTQGANSYLIFGSDPAISGAGTFIASASGNTVYYSGSTNIYPTTYDNLVTPATLTNTGTVTINSSISGVGTFINSTNATLNFAFAGVPGIDTLTATASGNTVNYTAAAPNCKVTTYHHLNFTGSGTVTCAVTTVNGNLGTSGTVAWTTGAGLTIGGNLTVGANTTLTQGNYAFTVNGTTGVSGTINTSGGATGTRTFTGLLTVNSGGTFNLSGQNPVTSFGAGITQSSSNSLNLGSGASSLVGNLSGSGTGGITWGGSLTIASGTTTNNYTGAYVYVTGDLVVTGNWAQGANSYLYYISDTAISGAGTLIATASPNTVHYAGSSATVYPTTYDTLSSSAIMTNYGTTTVNTALGGVGTFINGATGTLNIAFASAPTITTFTASASGNTVKYTAANPNCRVVTYHHLEFTGSGTVTCAVTTVNGNLSTSGTVSWTTSSNIVVTGDLAVGSGTTLAGTNSITVNGGDVSGAGDINMTGGTFLVDGASTTGFGSSSAWDFYALTFGDGTGTATTTAIGVGGITVANNMLVAANQTVNFETNDPALTVVGSFTVNALGVYTASTTGTWNVAGNYSNSGNVNCTGCVLTLDGLTSSTFNPGSATMYTIYINKTDADDADDNVTLTANNLRLGRWFIITDGEFIQGALDVRVENDVSVLSDGKWTNISTGDLALGTKFENQGVAIFNSNNGTQCVDGNDDIEISSINSPSTVTWVNTGTLTLINVLATYQEDASIYAYTSTLGLGTTWQAGNCGFTVTGVFYDADESGTDPGQCNGSTQNLSLRVNTGSAVTAFCAATSGSFSFSMVFANAGDTITIYSTGANKANLVYVSDGTADTNMHIYENTVVVGNVNGGATTILDLVDYDSTTDDTNMLYNAVDTTTDTLTTEDGVELHIRNSFTPNGTVTTSPSSSSSSKDGDLHIATGGVFTITNASSIGGDWLNQGSFSGNFVLTFTATSTGHVLTDGGVNFYAVTFDGSGGGWSFADSTTISSSLLVNTGTLSGNVDVSMSVYFMGNGTVNMTGGTVTQNIGSTSRDFGTQSGSSVWTFNNLVFRTYQSTPVNIITGAGTGNVNVTGTLTVGNTADSATVTLLGGSGSRTWNLSGSDNCDPFQVNDTRGAFTAQTSTFNFSGACSTADVNVENVDYNYLTLSGTDNFDFEGTTNIISDFTVDTNAVLVGTDTILIDDGSLLGAGDINLTGGSLTLDGGPVNMAGTQDWVFYNLSLGQSVTSTGSGSVTVSNVLSVYAGQTVDFKGRNWIFAGTTGSPINLNTTGVINDSTDTSTFTFTGNCVTACNTVIPASTGYNNIVFNNASEIFEVASTGAITLSGDLTVTNGSFTDSNSNVTINGSATGAGTIDLSGGTSTFEQRVAANESFGTTSANTWKFYKLIFSNSTGVQRTVTRLASSNTIEVWNQLLVSKTGDTAGTELDTYTNGGYWTFNGDSTNEPLDIDQASGVLTANNSGTNFDFKGYWGSGDIILENGNASYAQFSIGDGVTTENYDFEGDVSIGANFSIADNARLIGTDNITIGTTYGGGLAGLGDVILTGGTFTMAAQDNSSISNDNLAWDFYNLTFGNGSFTTITTASGGATITIANNLTITANQTLDASSKTWNIAGAYTNSGTLTESTSTFVFNGTSSVNLNSSCADYTSCATKDFYNLTINKTAAGDADDNVTLTGHLRANGRLTITDGELVQGAYNVWAGDTGATGTAVDIASAGKWTNISTGDLKLGGGFANAGVVVFNSNNGTQCTDGNNDIVISSTVTDTIRTWSGAGTFTMYNLDVYDMSDGALTITIYTSTKDAQTDWTDGFCGFTVTGTFFPEAESGNEPGQCNGSTANLSLRINGGAAITTVCTDVTGAFSFSSVSATAGQTITIYSTGANKANLVYVSDGTADTNMHLYHNALTVGNVNGGATTIANLFCGAGNDATCYDNDQNATDMLFDATDAGTDTLSVEDGVELHVRDTFTPTGNITLSPATTPSSQDGDLHVAGTINMVTNNLSIGGDYVNTGSYTCTDNSQTTTFTATATGFDIAPGASSPSFCNVTFNGASGGWSNSAAMTVANVLTMTNGTLSGTNNVTVQRDVMGTAGVINKTGGTFLQTISFARYFGPTTTNTDWIFNNLSFASDSGTQTVQTQSCSTCDVTVNGVLLVSTSGMAGTATILDAGDKTWTINSSAQQPVDTDGKGAASTINPQTSTFVYTGTYSSGDVVLENDAFNNLTLTPGGSETFDFEGNATLIGSLTVNTNATLSGTDDVTAYGAVTGDGTITMSSTSTFYAANSGNFGGNTAWTFNNLKFTSPAEGAEIAIMDAEENNTSDFTSVTGNITADAAAKKEGNYGYKLLFNGSANDINGTKDITTQTTDTYLGWWVYIPSGHSFGANSLHAMGELTSSTWGSRSFVWLESNASGVPYGWRLQTNANYTSSTTNFSLDAWHYMELAWIKGTTSTNGGGRLWVDGTLAAEVLSGNETSENIAHVLVGLYSGGAVPANGAYIYVDSVTIASSRITRVNSVATGTGGVTVAGTETIGANQTLDAKGKIWTLNGTSGTPLVLTGTLNDSTNTSTFTFAGANGGGNTTVPASSGYNNITLAASEVWDLAGVSSLSGDLVVNTGTFQGSSNITVAGNVTGSGEISWSSSTFEQRVATSKNFGSTSGSADWTFGALTFSNSSGSSVTITTQTGGSGQVNVTVGMLVSKTGDSAGTVLDAGNRVWTFANSDNDAPVDFDQATGSLTGNASTFVYSGDYNSGNVTLDNANYYNLTLGGATAENYDFEGAVIISGDLTVNTNATLTGSDDITVNGGDVTGGGIIDVRDYGANTFLVDGTGNFGSTNDWTFYNLTFGDGTGTATTTVIGTGAVGPLNLVVAANQTLDWETSGDSFDLWGNDFTINTGGTFSAPSTGLWQVKKTYVNNGTLVENNSTLSLDTETDFSVSLNSGCADYTSCSTKDFYNVTINKTDADDADDNVTLTGHLRVNGRLTITDGELIQGSYNVWAGDAGATGTAVSVASAGKWNNISTGDLKLGGGFANAGVVIFNSNNGTQCVEGNDDIVITSTSSPTQRTWSGAGTFTMYNVSVTDMITSGITITVYTSSLTNTTGWSHGCGFNVTGVFYDADEAGTDPGQCNGSTQNLSLRVDGGAAVTAYCTATTGAFTFSSVSATAGQTVAIYSTGANKANLIYISDGTADTLMHLYENTVVIGNVNATATTIADLWDYDSTQDDPNMLFNATDSTTDTLVVEDGVELHIRNNFTPTGNITTSTSNDGTDTNKDGDLHIASGATLAFTDYDATVGGDWLNQGDFTYTNYGFDVTFPATATGHTIAANGDHFYRTWFSGTGGGYSFTDATTYTDSNINVNAGTLSGTTDIITGGNVIGTAGVINLTAGTLTMDAGGDRTFGPSTASTNWSFNNLTFQQSSNTRTISTVSCATCGVTVNGIMLVGPTASYGTGFTFNAGDKTWTLAGTSTDPLDTDQDTITFNAETSTFVYTGNATGTVNLENAGFYNLQLSPSTTEIYTNEGALTVGGNLIVGANATLSQGNYAFTVSGTTDVSGTVNTINGATGTRTFTGLLTVNSGGTFTLTDQDPVASFGAGIVQNSANWIFLGNNAVTLVGNLSGSGSGRIDFGTGIALTIASGTTTNNHTGGMVFVGGTMNLNTGNWAQGANSYLYLSADAPFSGTGTFTASASGNLVVYAGSSTVVYPTTYYDLDMNGFGTSSGEVTVTNSLTGIGAFTNGVTGTLNIGFASAPAIATLNATASGNTVNYTAAAPNCKVTTYHHLNFTGSGSVTCAVTTVNGDLGLSGTVSWTTSSNIVVTGDLTVGSGTALAGTNNITVNGGSVTGAGDINMTGGTFLVDGTGNFGGSTAWDFELLTFGNGIDAETTTATGAGGFTTGSHTTIAANQVVDFETNDPSLQVGGDFYLNGTFTASSSATWSVWSYYNTGTLNENNSTITFVDSGALSEINSGCSDIDTCTTKDFYNLTINKTNAGATAEDIQIWNSGLRVTNVFTITDGEFIQHTYNVWAGSVSVASAGKWTNISTGDLKLGGGFANAGVVVFNSNNGTQCTDGNNDIVISSTVTDTVRTWSGAGTFTMYNLDVYDMSDGAITITIYTSTKDAQTDWTHGSCGVTISGTVYTSANEATAYDCSGDAGGQLDLRVTVNGGSNTNGVCNAANGTFSISDVTNPGAADIPVVLFISSAEGTKASTVTLSSAAGSITGLVLILDRVVVTHQGATAMTNAYMATADNADAGIRYSVSAGALTVEDGMELHIAANKTLTAGGTVTTSPSASASSTDGDIHIASGATLTAGGSGVYCGGDFINGQTFEANSTPLYLTATSTGHTFQINGDGLLSLEISDVNGGYATSGPITTGILTVNGAITGSDNITVVQDITGTGTINMSGGTVTQFAGANENFGTTSGTNNWTFSNLAFRNNGDPSAALTITTGSGTGVINVAGTLSVGNAGDSYATILDASNKTWNIAYNGSNGTDVCDPFQSHDTLGQLTASGSTFNYQGTCTASNVNVENVTYNNLTLGGADTFDFEGDTTINRALKVDTGATLSGTDNVTVKGSLVGAGTVNKTSGTVILDGAGKLAGNSSWTFNDLHIGEPLATTLPSTPTSITTCTELQNMSNDTAGHYILANDIDCSDTINWNSGAGFVPVGPNGVYFTGELDGQNYSISYLYINRPTTNYQGLFGALSAANIRNLKILSADVTAQTNGGVLAGTSYASTITNVYVSGTMTSTTGGYINIGGLVGVNGSGTIANCHSDVDVTANAGTDTNRVGGLVGMSQNSGTIIKDSSATGDVLCDDGCGGLVGNNGDSAIISNSFATGNITGIHVGGLVGVNYLVSPIIENSYATGTVTSTGSAGGLVDANLYTGIIRNSYATGSVTATGGAGGLVNQNYDHAVIENSYATGTVYSTAVNTYNLIGGLSGTNDNYSSITNSYATGSVTAVVAGNNNYVGGLVGENKATSTVVNSYATGAISGNSNPGGLIGNNIQSSTCTNSFWDTQTSGQATSQCGTGYTTSNMKTMSTFTGAGWSVVSKTNWFSEAWYMEDGVDYPRIWLSKYESTGTGSVTINGTLKVGTGENFDAKGKTWTLNGTNGTPFVLDGVLDDTANDSTFVFAGVNGSGNTVIPASTGYHSVTISPASSETFVTTGNMSLSGTLSTNSNTTWNSSGDLTNNGSVTGSGNIYLGGAVSGNGTVNMSGGNFKVGGIGNFGGNGNMTFNNLEFAANELAFMDAEENNTSDFSEISGNIAANTSAAKEGTYGYRVLFNGSTNSINGQRDITTQAADTYVGGWVYIPSGYSFRNNTVRTLIDMESSSWGGRVIASITTNGTGVPVGWRMQVGPTWTYDDSTTNFSLDAWHYIELAWIKGTTPTNGGGKLWVDGDLALSILDTNGDGADVTHVLVGLFGGTGNPDNGAYVYWDSITVANSRVGGTDTATGSGNITVNNSLTVGPYKTMDFKGKTWTFAGNVASPLVINGTFNDSTNTSTLVFTGNNGAGNTAIPASTGYNNLTFNGADTYAAAGAIALSGDLTVTAGTLSSASDVTVNGGAVTGDGDINHTAGTFTVVGSGTFGGNTAWDFNNLTFGNGVATAGTTTSGSGAVTATTLTISANHELYGASKEWILTGSGTPMVVNGTFTPASSTISYRGTGATNIVNMPYYDLKFEPTSGSPTYTLPSGTLNITHNLVVGNGTNAVSVTADSSDPTMNVSGSLSIGANSTFTGSNSGVLTLRGNWTNNGTFNHGSGTVIIQPYTETPAVIGGTQATNFYIFQASPTSSSQNITLQFKNGLTTGFAGTLNLSGQVGKPIYIQSDTMGQQWTMNLTGTGNVTNAVIRDAGCSGGDIVQSESNLDYGNNGACWKLVSRSVTGYTSTSGGGTGTTGGDPTGGVSCGTEEICDNFERATLGSNWTSLGGTPQIYNNSDFGGGTQTANNDVYYNTGTFSDNQFAEAVVATIGINNDIHLMVRASGPSPYYNAYILMAAADGICIYKYYNGGGGYLDCDTASPYPTTGSVLRIEVNGTAIKGYLNGVLRVEATDSDITTGRPGLGVQSNSMIPTNRVELWRAGNVVTGSTGGGSGGGGGTPTP